MAHKSTAAKDASRRTIGLRKRCKDALLIVSGNADAGIVDFAVHDNFRGCFRLDPRANRNLSLQ